MNAEQLAHKICHSLLTCPTFELEGLGVFTRDEAGGITFTDQHRPRVFIAYVTEDSALADRLYSDLAACGLEPWLDRKKLLPGQNWPLRIREAIEGADFFVCCFSRNSVGKRGGFQAEVRLALEYASLVPLDDIFLIPVRLDGCRVPARITRETQYVDLFPAWESGVARLVNTIGRQRLRIS